MSTKEVKASDVVMLFTKKGSNTSKKLSNSSTEYTTYWGLGSSVWNNTGDAAMLFQIYDWATTKVVVK